MFPCVNCGVSEHTPYKEGVRCNICGLQSYPVQELPVIGIGPLEMTNYPVESPAFVCRDEWGEDSGDDCC